MSRELPAVIEMEKKLLSAMMLREGKIIPTVSAILTEEDFYRPEHRMIYRAMLAIHGAGTPPDILLVEGELERRGELRRLDRMYLLSLMDMEYSTARAEAYAKTIKEKAILRRLIEAGETIIDEAYGEKDAEGILSRAEQAILAVNMKSRGADFESLQSMLERVLDNVRYKFNHPDELSGVTTGLIDLNRVLNGLQKSELILLAARPSMGKTALAMNIGWRAAYAGKVVAVYSLEMSKVQLGQRLMSTASGVNSQKINKGNFGDDEMNKLIRAVEDLNKLKMYIDDTAGLGILEMRSKARRLKHEVGLDLIIIDYLQLMSGSGQTENRQQEISEISRNLKAMARELEVPILALSQLSRSVEMRAEKKPQLSDLRESGSLEQDADVVMFLYRDEYYNRDDSQNQNLAELIIAKNRNGPTTTVRLRFDKEVMKFDDLTTVEKI